MPDALLKDEIGVESSHIDNIVTERVALQQQKQKKQLDKRKKKP